MTVAAAANFDKTIVVEYDEAWRDVAVAEATWIREMLTVRSWRLSMVEARRFPPCKPVVDLADGVADDPRSDT